MHANINTTSTSQPVDNSHTEQLVSASASLDNVRELRATEDESVTNSQNIFSTVVCGNTDLTCVSDRVHICDHLGRKRLKQGDFDCENSGLFWFCPRKYWTVSKREKSLQDCALEIVDSYLANDKDVVIITDKEYRWRNKDPSKVFFRHETPSHVVLCTRKLTGLSKRVGDNHDESFLNKAVVSCLHASVYSAPSARRAGVRQSDKSNIDEGKRTTTKNDTHDNNTSKQAYNTRRINAKEVPKAGHPRMSKQRTRRVSQSPDHKTGITDEYDLGDHATNNDKATEKPNYAKEYAKQKHKAKKEKKVELGTDDCGDDTTPLDDGDTSTFTTFSTECPDSDTETVDTEGTEPEKIYLNGMHELFAFIAQEDYNTGNMHIMEVYGGYGGVTRLAIRRGLVVGKNFDIALGVDLLKPGEQEKLLHYVRTFKPQVVVMGPPCTAFGTWARYNYIHAHDAWLRSYLVGYPLAVLAAKIAEIQMNAGRFFLAENPWQSELWNLPCWQQVLKRCYTAYCEQCVFGLQDMDGVPTLKPTAFVSNSKVLIEKLNQSCNGRHLYHSPLAGTLYGVSKTAYAARWPPELCRVIVTAIQRLCRTYNYPVVEEQPKSCPGCRSHAYRGSPKHNRIHGVCKFPDDTSDTLTCPACVRNLPSHHPQHTKESGCHWSTALPRLGSSRASSSAGVRVPQPTQHIMPDMPENIPSDNMPPQTRAGTWTPVTDLALISKLDDVGYMDGWHDWDEYDKVMVSSNTRYLREPQPRYDNALFSTRSTFARFLDNAHEHGFWWQLEEQERYEGKDRAIGYPVECLIHVFHR